MNLKLPTYCRRRPLALFHGGKATQNPKEEQPEAGERHLPLQQHRRESGRGLRALQNASRGTRADDNPPGFGVRVPMHRDRFCFSVPWRTHHQTQSEFWSLGFGISLDAGPGIVKVGRAVPSAPQPFSIHPRWSAFVNSIGALGTARPTLPQSEPSDSLPLPPSGRYRLLSLSTPSTGSAPAPTAA